MRRVSFNMPDHYISWKKVQAFKVIQEYDAYRYDTCRLYIKPFYFHEYFRKPILLIFAREQHSARVYVV